MTLAYLCAAVLVAALGLYLLGGGADFGGGILDLLARGERAPAQREAIEKAIGPVWEANHVWFVFVYTVYFATFPPAFAYTVTALFVPLSLYGVGIVVRGAAFTFRHYDSSRERSRYWGYLFAVASLICPFLLGMMGAALLCRAPLGQSIWTAFSLLSGLLVVGVVTGLAATYLCVVTAQADLQEDFRRRAIGAWIFSGACALIALAFRDFSGTDAKIYATDAFPLSSTRELAVVGVSICFGATTIALLAKRKFRWARLSAIALVTLVLAGWALAKGDVLARAEDGVVYTLLNAQAHHATQVTMLSATLVGSLVLFPSIALLYRIFFSRTTDGAAPPHAG
jgi:cytochrome bd ubiquinol oxidase subunit II